MTLSSSFDLTIRPTQHRAFTLPFQRRSASSSCDALSRLKTRFLVGVSGHGSSDHGTGVENLDYSQQIVHSCAENAGSL